jgi:hypothetical protein
MGDIIALILSPSIVFLVLDTSTGDMRGYIMSVVLSQWK